MNCLLETVSSMWLMTRRAAGVRPPVYEDETVQENLEGCRLSLEAREAELVEGCRRLAREALRRRQQGDAVGAKAKLMERRRGARRLERLRNNLGLVAGQIEALQSTELDKELMQTLLASSAALKRAGVGKGVREAEEVMQQLDEQMRESSELTSVLAGPVLDDFDFDLEEEFESLLNEGEILTVAPGVGVAGAAAGGREAGASGVGRPPAQLNSTRPQPEPEAAYRADAGAELVSVARQDPRPESRVLLPVFTGF
jgi:hypothetical protein